MKEFKCKCDLMDPGFYEDHVTIEECRAEIDSRIDHIKRELHYYKNRMALLKKVRKEL